MGAVLRDDSWDSVFPTDLIPRLFDLVCRAWPRIGAFPSDTREDAISRKLVARMRLVARRSRTPVTIASQYELLGSQGEVLGKIDILVHPGLADEVYFSFECKRLNVVHGSGPASGAGKYCDEGMMRYVNEQYAAGLGRGGMIGYVMDGRRAEAVKAINKAMVPRRENLRLAHGPSLRRSCLPLRRSYLRDTQHRTVRERDFTIHHVFLPMAGARSDPEPSANVRDDEPTRENSHCWCGARTSTGTAGAGIGSMGLDFMRRRR